MEAKLLAACAEHVAAEEAKEAHMKKYPWWWAEGNASFDSLEKCLREPNVEWSSIVVRRTAALEGLLTAAREVVAEQKKEAA